jgi:hypothetical protein
MLKKIKCIFFLVLMTTNAFSQLPDFQNAVPFDAQKNGLIPCSQEIGQGLEILNACKVGNYMFEVYFEKDGILYNYFSCKAECFKDFNKNNSNGIVLTDDEVQTLSSHVPIFFYGTWWIRCKVECDFVFKFVVSESNSTRKEFKLGCN